jgi:hypothetical protein
VGISTLPALYIPAEMAAAHWLAPKPSNPEAKFKICQSAVRSGSDCVYEKIANRRLGEIVVVYNKLR